MSGRAARGSGTSSSRLCSMYMYIHIYILYIHMLSLYNKNLTENGSAGDFP
jgi:hypothetical protein